MANSFQTVGTIAERFGVPVHRIVYVVRTRGIKPAGKAGVARVFDEDAVKRISEALKEKGETR